MSGDEDGSTPRANARDLAIGAGTGRISAVSSGPATRTRIALRRVIGGRHVSLLFLADTGRKVGLRRLPMSSRSLRNFSKVSDARGASTRSETSPTDQAASLRCRQKASRFLAYAVLKPLDGRTRQRTENSVPRVHCSNPDPVMLPGPAADLLPTSYLHRALPTPLKLKAVFPTPPVLIVRVPLKLRVRWAAQRLPWTGSPQSAGAGPGLALQARSKEGLFVAMRLASFPVRVKSERTAKGLQEEPIASIRE